ncbi:MAG: dTDP-4-dehydrorhamnose reductase [Chitinophagaceae bacterium]
MRKKILVTGANGQVGKELRDISNTNLDCDYTFLSKEDLPIENFNLLHEFFRILQPDILINCAAYTAVDKAEEFRDLAFLINGEAVGQMAAICKEFNTRFIHISTDYVFEGNSIEPYKINDPLKPINTYGASKLEGELLAMTNNPDSSIIRTSWVYSSYGNNFVKTMLRLMGEQQSINVVSDQFGSPTYAADLAEVLLQIGLANQYVPGIYHYSNSGKISWFDFAQEIALKIQSSCKVNPIPTKDYPTPAKRPSNSTMDLEKIEKTYGIHPKPWKESLYTCLGKLGY